MTNQKDRVCPVERANSLDNKFRKWLQNPKKILMPYIKEGMAVLDIGCGPGFFTIEIAKMVGEKGRVLAVDIQVGMLQKVSSKIKGTELEKRIKLIQSESDKINVTDKVDFILAFWMVHEVPDKNSFFKELYIVLKETGQFLVVEPKHFHVSKKEFELTLKTAKENGFKIMQGPKLLLSQTALLKKT
ncbi:MAG: class I SAM-dependent methyltransferase [Ignavibacteriaceae bacterium]|nr:class I SAM-dependent methyltransferase [Ignavibacteriaceae bacterium]